MASIPHPDNRTFLVRSVADGLYRENNGGPRGTDDMLALLVAERVVQHLDSLGFIVLRHVKWDAPKAP